MATQQTETGRRLHPVIWVLVGVLGTLAAVAAVSSSPQLAGRQLSPTCDESRTTNADATLPLPPVPPEPAQPFVIPVLIQATSDGQGHTPQAPKPTPDTPKDIPDRTFANPEEVVKAYINAKRWEDRLPCVLDPKSVRQVMAARYKNVDLTTAKNEFLPGKLTVHAEAGGKLVVEVDVRESLPYHQRLRYSVVKSGPGYKVSWLESLTLGDEDNQRAEVNQLGLTNPVLEVQIVKKHQEYSYATFDIRVANRSNKLLLYWSIEASICDSDGAYLGKVMTNGSNLKSGGEVFAEISFKDVKTYDIASWKPQIGAVSIEVSSGVRAEATKHFTLKELKARTR